MSGRLETERHRRSVWAHLRGQAAAALGESPLGADGAAARDAQEPHAHSMLLAHHLLDFLREFGVPNQAPALALLADGIEDALWHGARRVEGGRPLVLAGLTVVVPRVSAPVGALDGDHPAGLKEEITSGYRALLALLGAAKRQAREAGDLFARSALDIYWHRLNADLPSVMSLLASARMEPAAEAPIKMVPDPRSPQAISPDERLALGLRNDHE